MKSEEKPSVEDLKKEIISAAEKSLKASNDFALNTTNENRLIDSFSYMAYRKLVSDPSAILKILRDL